MTYAIDYRGNAGEIQRRVRGLKSPHDSMASMIHAGQHAGSACPAELRVDGELELSAGMRARGLGGLGRKQFREGRLLEVIIPEQDPRKEKRTHLKFAYNATKDPDLRWLVARYRGDRYQIVHDGVAIVTDVSLEIATSLVAEMRKT